MIRLILIFIAGVLVYFAWKWTMSRYEHLRRLSREKSEKREEGVSGKMSELVQDPVCKLYIAKDKSIFHKDKHFCSEKCKNEFKE